MARASLISLVLLALLPAPAGADGGLVHRSLDAAARTGPSFVPGEVIVRFRKGAEADVRAATLSRSGARASSSLGERGVRLVRLRRGESVRAAAARLERSSQVVYAQPNYRYRLATVPNDPRFGELWGLANSGQPVQGIAGAPDADIDATDAWSLTTGRPSTTVAIADSGLALDHPDLAPNLWHNPGESGHGRETNHRDDDHDGFVDDWRGWDFVDGDNEPSDLNGHGTHVAGIAGARGNNAFGTAGVSWQVGLMPVRVADAVGVVSDAAIVRGFDYAAARGARVVNASFVSAAYSDILRDSIRRHPKVLFVAAAGNGDPDGIGDDNDTSPQYPCSFGLVNLLCVAASDQSDRLAPFSNFGRATVDVAAPGTSVLSAAPAYATLFSSGFETDLAGTWVAEKNSGKSWDRTSLVARSGAFSVSDSPGDVYDNLTDSWIRTAAPVSLAGQHGCRLEYALRLNTETGVDRLVVEVSTDGVSWAPVSDASGSSEGAFVDLFDDIGRFDGASALWVRFRLVTNEALVGDGAQLDDVAVRCLGASYTGAELAYNDGTSMAAPHVSGTAALVLSRYKDLGPSAVAQAIVHGADRRPTLSGKLRSGRLNVLRSLREGAKLVPKLKLTGVSRQRAARKGSIVLFAKCTRRCTVAGSGSISLGKKKGPRLKRAVRAVAAHKRKRLVIKLSAKTQARVKSALKRGRRVSARVTVIATDSLGSTARAKRTVRIAR